MSIFFTKINVFIKIIHKKQLLLLIFIGINIAIV